MRIDRVLIALIVVALVAAAAIFFSRKTPGEEESVAAVEVERGVLSLLVIGVEGLDLSIVERLSEDGRLPNLTSLMDGGALGKFRTLGKAVEPRISWTSLATGVTPERQGIGGTKVSARGDTIKASLVPRSRTVGTLWTALSERGDRVGVLGWWGTWPVEQLDGVVVAPYTTYYLERRHNGPPERQLHPMELLDVVDPVIVDPEAFSRQDLSGYVDTESRLGLEALIGKAYVDLSMAHAGDRSMRDAALAVASVEDLSAEFVLLPGTELVSQRFWHMANPDQLDWNALNESTTEQVTAQVEALGGVIDLYYDAVDAIVGDLLELAAADATVALVSDHGYDGLQYDKRGHPMLGLSMHSERGFWVLNGPSVRQAVRVGGLGLLDFAPTLAEAYGITLSDETDGSICEEMLAR